MKTIMNIHVIRSGLVAMSMLCLSMAIYVGWGVIKGE